MNKDIRLKVTFPTHKKTVKLIRMAGHEALTSLLHLWCYTAQNHPKGILDNHDRDDIEIISDWKGEPKLFIKTILKVGYINKIKDGFELHDWAEHNPFAFHAKERSEKARLAASSKWGGESSGEKTNSQLRSDRLKKAKEKGSHNPDEWKEMLAFFEGKCVICGDDKGIVKDHIVPIYKEGSDSITNLQPLCRSCNSSKGADDTDQRLTHCERNGFVMPAKWLQVSALMSPPSPDPSPLPPPPPKPKKKLAGFEDFWKAYPKKKSKGQAETTWNKLSPTNDLLQTMLIAIEAAKKSEDWMKQNGAYIPHPSTWLNAKGWEDEIIEAKDCEIKIGDEVRMVTQTEFDKYREERESNGRR